MGSLLLRRNSLCNGREVDLGGLRCSTRSRFTVDCTQPSRKLQKKFVSRKRNSVMTAIDFIPRVRSWDASDIAKLSVTVIFQNPPWPSLMDLECTLTF